jgi:hypothetical protein
MVGLAFIALGLWTILQYFANERAKTIVFVGLAMSVEAMLITMGITLILLPHSTWVIPLTVAAAHFGYMAFSFYLARTKYARRFSPLLSHVVSGAALIIYGALALFVDFGVV